MSESLPQSELVRVIEFWGTGNKALTPYTRVIETAFYGFRTDKISITSERR